MAYVSGNRNATLTLGARFSEVWTGVVEGYRAWRVYRETLNELQSLSMRELSDLGLSRSMLRSVAMEAAYGKQD